MRASLCLLLGCLVAIGGCDRSASGGHLAPRLVPLTRPIPAATAAAVEVAWKLAPVDVGRAGDSLVGVRLADERHSARVVAVPGRAVTRVPEGIREVRFWLSDPLPWGHVAEDCRVTADIEWTAGAKQQFQLAPKSNGGSWLAVRLRAAPRQKPTVLRVRFRASSSCVGSTLLVAHSEVIPVAARALQERPDVVLIVLDTVRRDRFDCGPTTQKLMPHVYARWCSRGVFFTNAYSTSSWTYPAVSSIHTGYWPRDHGAGRVHGKHTQLDPRVPTLAELLRRRGYSTFGITPNAYASRGLARGFDTYRELYGSWVPFDEGRRASHVVDDALAWLDQVSLKPVFLSLLFIDAHEPVDGAKEAGPLPKVCQGVKPIPYRWEGLSHPSDAPTTAASKRIACRRALYDQSLTYIDEQLNRLFEHIVRSRSATRTAFILVADHGEELWDHAAEEYASHGPDVTRWGVDHGQSLHEEITHVPLLVVPPASGGEAPKTHRSDALVSNADVFATALSMAGAPIPTSSPSRDLTWASNAFFGLGRAYVLSEETLYGPDAWAVTTPELRALLTAGGDIRVYDRKTDPRELAPLSVASPLFKRGEDLLDRALRDRSAKPVSRVDAAALRALGYVQ